jgi:hypothetical protein
MRTTIVHVKIRADAQLQSSPEFQIGVGLPAPLSGRLDGLVDRADGAGARTNRKELLGALLLAATVDGEALSELVQRYRKATVGEARIPGQPDGRFLEPDRPPPGPRPRREL